MTCGNFGRITYWGIFENDVTETFVLDDFYKALNNLESQPKNHTGKYILAFIIGNYLYISRRGYHALIKGKELFHVKDDYFCTKIIPNMIFALDKNHIDDVYLNDICKAKMEVCVKI